MAFVLVDEEEKISPQQVPSNLQKGAQFAEGVAHVGAGMGASALSAIGGAPGSVLEFLNDVIAKPVSEAITGKKGTSYQESTLGKLLPTIQQGREALNKTLPYLKPRNQYEKTTNDITETLTTLLLPGAQANVGKFLRTTPLTRALFKSIGSEAVKEGVKDWTGSEEKGNMAKAGALFSFALLDRPGAQSYISQLYRQAENSLQAAGNPAVSSPRTRTAFTQLRNRLTQGTLAPSEQAVVGDIDRALGHFNNNDVRIENLWGISRSLNERKQDVMRSLASREGRERARSLYGNLIRSVNEELRDYGRRNPSFGVPFQEAQEGFATIAQSRFIGNAAEKLLDFKPHNQWLMHAFGVGAAPIAGKVLGPQVAAIPAAYSTAKILYRMHNSTALRRYYLEALRAASREDAPMFNKAFKKMDAIVSKEDSQKSPYRLLDEER